MQDHVTSQSEITKAMCYVCATDRFMSGWGYAKDTTNRLIFPCNSRDEVDAVMDNCENRQDFIRVTLCHKKPSLRRGVYYQLKTKESSPNFYKPGYFSK
jgi:hypothetical protein